RTIGRQRAELARMVADFQAAKREMGVVDYGDQIAHAAQLAKEHPEVGERFRKRYSVVLLDEYQDTNLAQADLMRHLVGPGFPIFAVGDPDQNIYAWRGATLRNILGFGDDFGASNGELPLYVNFRSGSRILAAANHVIEPVPVERRAAGKILHPHEPLGEGRVLGFVAEDQRAEAGQIARMIEEMRGSPRRDGGALQYGDFVVLCRKKRLFGPIAEVLRQEGLPVEIVDLGGLLQLPEIVDVVAWLRLLENPGDNVSLARILFGPRWRIGYRDLAVLAHWSADQNRSLADELDADRSPGEVRFALVEAVDHLDEIEGLSPEARERLEEFRIDLAGLRERVRQPLGDLVAEVLEVSGLLRELEASTSPPARAARRNLLNLVDHVAAFTSLDGEATLSAFIAYLNAALEAEDELEPAQASESDTVKLMTVHKAKGLEWPVVFVPGMAEHERPASSIFPNLRTRENPLLGKTAIPLEMRRDEADFPDFEGDIDAWGGALREQQLEEERRLGYVALTRAQETLVVSAAYWYEGPQDPYRPSRFFDEVTGSPGAEVLFVAEQPEENPIAALLAEKAADWPGPGRREDADELFPEGWRGAAIEAASSPDAAERRAESVLGPRDLEDFRRLGASHRERAARIEERVTSEGPPALPATLSVSSVIDLERCPKLFYWSHVRPLPRRPSSAARLGSEVHRWIELQSRGQASLLDVDEIPDLGTEERMGEPGVVAEMRRAFRESRFSESVPLYAERPFLLYLEGSVVGGRIDAIFGEPHGPWEVVDYKTGRKPEDDPLAGLQLDLYALACVEIWGKAPEELTLTYFYLASGEEETRPAGDPEVTRKRVLEAIRRAASGEFEARPGPQCRWCDFRQFCEPGASWVREQG
ncbi:MAG TPA: ATP-dependent DNA helicase, partial [Actinomycetota bacterium]